MDLHACLTEPVTLAAGQRTLIPSGIAIALPSPAYVALIFARSGLAIKHGIALSNGVGVIDSDYRGEIKIGMVNLSDTDYTIQPGESIAQMAVLPVCCLPVEICDDLGATARGDGGFGSTGKGLNIREEN